MHEILVPQGFGENLRLAQHFIVDLDDTVIVYDLEKTILGISWFFLCDKDPAIDPSMYQVLMGQSPQKDELIRQIEAFSKNRFDDPDYLLRAGAAWANAFRTAGERDMITKDVLGYYNTEEFLSRYGTFRRNHSSLQDDTDDTYIAEGAIDFLNWTNQQGKNLYVISNSPAFVIETYIRQIEASGYRAGFTHVISAWDIGREFRKPHPASFQQLLDSLQPQEAAIQAVYIGNEQGDVLFATNATNQLNGIHVVPVLITRGLDYSHIKMPPHCRFPSFTHLKEFLISPI